MEQITKRARDMKVGDILLVYGTPTIITRKVEMSPGDYNLWLSYIGTRDGNVSSFESFFYGNQQSIVMVV